MVSRYASTFFVIFMYNPSALGVYCFFLVIIHLFYLAFSCPNFRFDLVMPQMKAMAEDAQPLLAEVRDNGLLKEVENLTRSLTQATDDLRLIVHNIKAPVYI